MAKVIIYKEDGSIEKKIRSAHTPDWEGVPNALINPELPDGVVWDKYLDFNTKVVNGKLEKTTALNKQKLIDDLQQEEAVIRDQQVDDMLNILLENSELRQKLRNILL